jgi:hypothetical protein
MDQIQELLTGLRGLQNLQPLHSVSLAACGLLAVVFLVYRLAFASRYPKNLPRLGEEDGQSWNQIRKRFDKDCLEVYNEAYQKVGALLPVTITTSADTFLTLVFSRSIVFQEGPHRPGAHLWSAR